MMLHEKIKNWIKEYSDENGNLSLVVGISGGIDSAVVSTLCALTGKETVVVSMPIHQNKDELDRANDHIDWLCANFKNVTSRICDLTNVFETFKHTLETENQLSLANLRSRIRMSTLYHYATIESGIVVGTGNKIEDFGIGFFTKYGDGGVDISPIADLTKTEVRNLARQIGVSENIIKAKPTDGLWQDGRCDEDQIGASYEELEWAMANVDESESKLDDRQTEVMRIYKNLNTKNRHKMLPIPIYKK